METGVEDGRHRGRRPTSDICSSSSSLKLEYGVDDKRTITAFPSPVDQCKLSGLHTHTLTRVDSR